MKSISILHNPPGITWLTFFVQVVWNVFPANSFTSTTLLFSHLLMLWGTWALPAPFPLVRHILCIHVAVSWTVDDRALELQKIKALEKRKRVTL